MSIERSKAMMICYGRQISFLKSEKHKYVHQEYVKRLKILWFHYSKYKKEVSYKGG